MKENLFEEEMKSTREHIKRLEKEMAIMRKGPFARESEFIQSLPEQQREELLKAVEGLDFDTSDLGLSEIDFEEMFNEIEKEGKQSPAVTIHVPPKDRAFVKKFNAALETSDAKSKRALLVWYLRCQTKVPRFSSFLSNSVWDHLWQTQIDLHPRSKHIVMLGDDMRTAGISLGDHLTDYLAALHATGETTSALQIWEQERGEAGIGAQLYAALGMPYRAEEVAFSEPQLDADTILPVIQAWAESEEPDAVVRLWAFYNRIPRSADLLGQITSILLNAGRRDVALAVFRDMMGHNIVKTLDASEINEINLTALFVLPRKYKNKFFFAAWMKWLIGKGKLDEAAAVVELMGELGVRPDAIHLNGLLAAWFRQGSSAGRRKAEQIAWAMIEERIRRVQERDGGVHEPARQLFPADKFESPQFPFLLRGRNMPAATIETFSILVQRFTRMSDAAKAEDVTQLMTGPAQIPPNSYVLNHWLYMSLRTTDLSTMWKRYQRTTDLIRPDLQTFVALWDGARRSLRQAGKFYFATPRQLYREMAIWFSRLSPAKQAEVRGQFSSVLAEQIIRCFCLQTDLPCILVALRHMRENFDILPHEEILGMIIMQVSKLTPVGQMPFINVAKRLKPVTPARPLRVSRARPDAAYRAALGNFTKAMQDILNERIGRAEVAGAVVDLVDGRETRLMQSLRLDAIETFLCLIILRRSEADLPANTIVTAAGAIGVQVEREEAQRWLDDAVKEYEQAHDV